MFPSTSSLETSELNKTKLTVPSGPDISKNMNGTTLGARDFSSAVSGFCQVFIVTGVKSL